MYEKAFLAFRYPPGEGLTGEALDKYLSDIMGDIERALEDIIAPSIMDHVCFSYAMDLYATYTRHGLLFDGAYMDQPAFEMHVLDCILTAQERAGRETRAAEAKMRNAERDTIETGSGEEGSQMPPIDTASLGV